MSNSTRPPSPAHHSSAPEQRLDLVTGLWIILAADRQHRPHDFAIPQEQRAAESCAFCAGHEDQTTPTAASYPPASETSPFAWQVRVIDNRYPAFVGAQSHSIRDASPERKASVGRHEVIIESPTHCRQITELPPEDVEVVFRSYRDRMLSVRDDTDYKYAIVFKNSGRDAGMSREHLHSQLVAMPHAPPVVRLELDGARRYFNAQQQCVFCRLVQDVDDDSTRRVMETDRVIAFCPYASRVPFEVCIMPKEHRSQFEESDVNLLAQVSAVTVAILRGIQSCLGQVAYNQLIHSNPFDTRPNDHYHWHIEILPRIGCWAGLEWGTGQLINTVPPEEAAKQLRDAVGV